MKRNYGELQSELLSTLKYLCDDDYWYSMHGLIEITGRHQQSIHRAMKRLISESLVIEKSDKIELQGYGLPKQYKLYMLKSNDSLQLAIDDEKAAKSKKIKDEADALGISEQEHRFNTFFTNKGA